MGGNAIKKNGVSICRRIPAESYKIVKERVLEVLSTTFVCEVVPELKFKVDFGDVDVLYVPNDDIQVVDAIKLLFDIRDPDLININGSITSFALDCSFAGLNGCLFQVDMIQVRSLDHLRMAAFFDSYGGLGVIIGPIFKCCALKLSDSGLWCNLLSETSDSHICKILLTDSPQAICAFAGLDIAQWESGFPASSAEEEIDSICAWAAASPRSSAASKAVTSGRSTRTRSAMVTPSSASECSAAIATAWPLFRRFP